MGTNVRLELSEPACSVGFDVLSLERWPIWPWLVEGAEVEISLWDAGRGGRGGEPLWMVLRDSMTGNPLMSIYQLDGAWLRSGQVRDELGMDVNVLGPVCESSRDPLLAHIYDIEISTMEATIRLPSYAEGLAPSSSAPPSWRVQAGVLANTFGHLVGPNDVVRDVRWGEFFQFVAWTEQR